MSKPCKHRRDDLAPTYTTVQIEKRIADTVLLTEKQAANYIGMSRSYLRQSRVNGQLSGRTRAPPFIKIGRSVRYPQKALDKWIDDLLLDSRAFHRNE